MMYKQDPQVCKRIWKSQLECDCEFWIVGILFFTQYNMQIKLLIDGN